MRSAAGMEKTSWPGRLESIDARPRVLLDAAHNPDGARALARYLHGQPEAKRVLVFGTMRDKDWRAMLGALLPEASTAVFCAPPLGRAEDPAVLAAAFEGTHVARDVADAVRRAQRLAGKRGLVVVCGSIFVLAPARALLLGIESDPPIAM
jgi:dihydrofolate synthase/folylpolyglutamate synthase